MVRTTLVVSIDAISSSELLVGHAERVYRTRFHHHINGFGARSWALNGRMECQVVDRRAVLGGYGTANSDSKCGRYLSFARRSTKESRRIRRLI